MYCASDIETTAVLPYWHFPHKTWNTCSDDSRTQGTGSLTLEHVKVCIQWHFEIFFALNLKRYLWANKQEVLTPLHFKCLYLCWMLIGPTSTRHNQTQKLHDWTARVLSCRVVLWRNWCRYVTPPQCIVLTVRCDLEVARGEERRGKNSTAQTLYGDQIEKGETGGTCGTYRGKKCLAWETWRDHLADLVVEGRINRS